MKVWGQVPNFHGYAIRIAIGDDMDATTISQANSVQMNVRIGDRLKRAGDDVLLQLGMTPSAAVRGLWEFLVARQDDPEAVRAVIDPTTSQSVQDHKQMRQRTMQAVRSRYGQLAISLGIEGAASAVELTWDELRDMVYDARLEELQ